MGESTPEQKRRVKAAYMRKYRRTEKFKVYERKRAREYRRRNPDKFRILDARANAHKAELAAENQARLAAIKLERGCFDCGYRENRYALEWDHVRGQKLHKVSWLARRARPWEEIEAEIAKCEVRCANCHRIRTYESGQHLWRRYDGEAESDPGRTLF